MNDLSVSDLIKLVNIAMTSEWTEFIKLALFCAILLLTYAGYLRIKGKPSGDTHNNTTTNNYYYYDPEQGD